MAATGPIFDEIQKFLRPSDRELPGDYFGLWNFWKRSFLAWVTDDQSLVPNRGTFCYVFTPSVTFSGFHCFHFQCVLFLVISFQTPPSKILRGYYNFNFMWKSKIDKIILYQLNMKIFKYFKILASHNWITLFQI